MHGVLPSRVAEARAIERTIMQGAARMCSRSQFGVAAKALWPNKTAETLAALAGCSIRAAAYEISGEREPSALSVAAMVVEVTKRS